MGSAALTDVVTGLAESLAAVPDSAGKARELATLYDVLVTDGGVHDEPPTALLAAIRQALESTEPEAWDSLNSRARTAYRLIVAGADLAAWDLLTEATRLARDGVERIEPAYVFIDGARVFAWLPGFRDPRFDAPDDCYELTDDVKLRVRVDEAGLDANALTLAGTAYLSRGVRTGPDEQISVVLHRDGMPDVVVDGTRHRRPDLVSGNGIELTRRAWSGWSVSVSLAALPSGSGRWRISLAIAHGELHRGAAVGTGATALVRSVNQLGVRRRRTAWRVDTSESPWALVARWQRWPRLFG